MCVARAIMGIPSDRRFLAVAATRLAHLFPDPPQQPGFGPIRADESGPSARLAPIRQRIESIFWTCKDLLTLERHGARTLQGLRERILARFRCLAAAITLNHQDAQSRRVSDEEAARGCSVWSGGPSRGARHFVAGKSIKRLVRETGLSKKTIRRALCRNNS